MQNANRLAVVILAAGQGTRMKSKTPKVLHKVAGRSLIAHVLATASQLDPSHIVVVVRHQKELAAAAVNEFLPSAIVCEQDDIPGTGRAVEQAIAALPADFNGDIVVLSGDVPLINEATLRGVIAAHRDGSHQMTILAADVANPQGLGRILYDNAGRVSGIVEEKDATETERQITEINGGIYVFERRALTEALAQIDTDNVQKEKYLTDAAAKIIATGGSVAAHTVDDVWLIAGVNDRAQLAAVGSELNRRLVLKHQLAGVTIVDPRSTYIDVTVEIEADVTLLPGVLLQGATRVATGATVGPATTLKDTSVATGAVIVRSEVHGAKIAAGVTVGPFAYIRPGTTLGERSKVGAFVEVKASQLGAGGKVPHLSYVGDATIGEGANLGAGTIVANYDGVKKHRTTVGREVRVGAKSVLVAPVTVGDGAYSAAGAVIRKEVPPGALAVSVASQRNIPDWVLENRPNTDSARAVTDKKEL
ncbi:bifunctional UDP-N-acetylglucosamine diphosphorylase/glucosamine-1-phosphate N-acetyltransferase GlmU [Canibacter sp. lx-72]|uniref:bifunctional UDP-N-acetylglucosamine diphosphorylase/glucosamine-1-phosphate N-acetyltransferase GlmU n=1 Tax=Canibacter zhuwentaonis TaxID=2837491 RepID=UPI001BDBD355|nr:bifunctional UDP-N-acetylglucosamine diphosphorylase/glucosamine-1-phosphate N-acetyltransferase GlmU [Canibacter zhuwentaonis]MBT1018274.1 bifunctional UDP-N-acetylglucosamine diphosphorylase/glucosamine-1-phosphate N-acetyltransferase GlmU [Canibacter zhuwentaonis]MBT1035284.1 bifunctional UDP-N-acetylglucosamine diphosphorylase/glucosamine-1-phosphate N-acetyltransferase GlmU [Canibacter zhuwentaonis]